MSRIKSLELVFNLVKGQIKSKQDCIVTALHCLLINENLQCVGTGEEFSEEDVRSTTELLPNGWNENQEVYTLRYISKDGRDRFLVKAVTVGKLMNLVIVLNEKDPVAMSANIDKLISDDFNDYSSAYNDLDIFKNAFKKEVVETLLAKPSLESSSKPSSSNRPSPLRMAAQPVPRPRNPISPDFGDDAPPFAGGRPGFGNIGGRDLDPLGRSGGGMLLDPSNFGVPRGGIPFGPPPGLPRGAVPPGARFDPFGPPIRGPNRPGPNPDHFKPPDFDDFM